MGDSDGIIYNSGRGRGGRGGDSSDSGLIFNNSGGMSDGVIYGKKKKKGDEFVLPADPTVKMDESTQRSLARIQAFAPQQVQALANPAEEHRTWLKKTGDFLSLALYPINDMATKAIEGGSFDEIVHAGWQGFKGAFGYAPESDKKTYNETLGALQKKYGWEFLKDTPNKIDPVDVLGLTLNIFGDPLFWVPIGGVASKLGKYGFKGAELLSAGTRFEKVVADAPTLLRGLPIVKQFGRTFDKFWDMRMQVGGEATDNIVGKLMEYAGSRGFDVNQSLNMLTKLFKKTGGPFQDGMELALDYGANLINKGVEFKNPTELLWHLTRDTMDRVNLADSMLKTGGRTAETLQAIKNAGGILPETYAKILKPGYDALSKDIGKVAPIFDSLLGHYSNFLEEGQRLGVLGDLVTEAGIPRAYGGPHVLKTLEKPGFWTPERAIDVAMTGSGSGATAKLVENMPAWSKARKLPTLLDYVSQGLDPELNAAKIFMGYSSSFASMKYNRAFWDFVKEQPFVERVTFPSVRGLIGTERGTALVAPRGFLKSIGIQMDNAPSLVHLTPEMTSRIEEKVAGAQGKVRELMGQLGKAIDEGPNAAEKVAQLEKQMMELKPLMPYLAEEGAQKYFAKRATQITNQLEKVEGTGSNVTLINSLKSQLADAEDMLKFSKVSGQELYKMPSAVADFINNFHSIQTTDPSMKGIRKIYDSFTNLWRPWVTVANPAFWQRNFLGALWNNAQQGIVNPIWYYKAQKIISDGQKAIRDGLQPSEMYLKMVKSGSIDRGYFTLMNNVSPVKQLENALEDGNMTGIQKVFSTIKDQFTRQNVWLQFGHAMNNKVENLVRGTNFLFHHEGQGLSTGAAALKVKAAHFEYSPEFATKFDNTARVLFPFWVWSRNNLPYQLERLVNNPKTYIVKRGIYDLFQRTSGETDTERQYRSDFMNKLDVTPIPTEAAAGIRRVGGWMAGGIGKMAGYILDQNPDASPAVQAMLQSWKDRGFSNQEGVMYLSPNFPFNDLNKFGDIQGELYDMLNPLIKAAYRGIEKSVSGGSVRERLTGREIGQYDMEPAPIWLNAINKIFGDRPEVKFIMNKLGAIPSADGTLFVNSQLMYSINELAPAIRTVGRLLPPTPSEQNKTIYGGMYDKYLMNLMAWLTPAKFYLPNVEQVQKDIAYKRQQQVNAVAGVARKLGYLPKASDKKMSKVLRSKKGENLTSYKTRLKGLGLGL